MAYRGEDAGDTLEAPTADGNLSVSFGPNRLTLAIGPVSLHLVDRVATVTELTGKKQKTRRTSYAITGIIFARGVPRDDVGLWIEAKEDIDAEAKVRAKHAAAAPKPAKAPSPAAEPVEPHPSLRRIFGAAPVSLMEPTGLKALAKLDAIATRLRVAVSDYAAAVGVWSARATEIGAGHPLDKVLLVDYGERHAIYARKLFRDRARFLASVQPADHKVIVPDGKTTHQVTVVSRFGVTVRGDYIRFADKHGTDQARISVPWVGPEDREELARRIGNLVHRT
jgi:hypothetical protein